MVGGTGGRSRADFRALRERLGLTVANLAADLGVSESAARRWDTTDGYRPPIEAWSLLDWYSSQQRQAVLMALEDAQSVDGVRTPIPIAYFRSQTEYDAQVGGGHVGVANAVARAVGDELRRHGFSVRYYFSSEKSN